MCQIEELTIHVEDAGFLAIYFIQTEFYTFVLRRYDAKLLARERLKKVMEIIYFEGTCNAVNNNNLP